MLNAEGGSGKSRIVYTTKGYACAGQTLKIKLVKRVIMANSQSTNLIQAIIMKGTGHVMRSILLATTQAQHSGLII